MGSLATPGRGDLPHPSQSRALRLSATKQSAPPISLARGASSDKAVRGPPLLSSPERDSWQISWFALSSVPQASGQNARSENLPVLVVAATLGY